MSGTVARTCLWLCLLFVSTFYLHAAHAAPEDPQEGGAWSEVINWPMIPVSAANLPDGRILAWASNERTSFPAGPEFTYTAVWDPDSGTFTEINHPSHDMFCSHHVMLEDGTVFVSGGRNQGNSPWTSTFDYETNQWVQHPNMNRGRWYPTSVVLPGDKVMTMIGSGGGNTAEMWDGVGSWTLLGGLNFDVPILNYGHGERNWWPLLHLAPDGRIFHSGPTPNMHYIDTDGIGSITQTNTHTAWYPKHGTAVMYDEGKILSAGGWVDGGNTASVPNAMVIDLNGPSPVITPIANMNFPRKFQNGVTLPNGEVLIVGGNTSGIKFNDSGTIYPIEIFNPVTETFRVGASMSVPRNYHSVALLMLDGRVLSGGGGLCNCAADHQDAQIYSPPYLFNADGTPATRPVITQVAGVVETGQTLSVQATPGMQAFSMVKMSSTTHAVNSDLRFLPVSFTENSAGDYALSLHTNQNVMTPGYWMLFALNAQGTPSVAKVIRVSTQGLEIGPPVIKQMSDMTTLHAERVDLTVTASDPDGDALTYSATNLPGGLSINATSGIISGIANTEGVFNVTITVDDGSEGTASTTLTWQVFDASHQPGVVYEYYEGSHDFLPDFNQMIPEKTGVVSTFSLSPREQEDFFLFRFNGRVQIDTAGTYTFYTASDDGSQLFINGTMVVNNDGLHGTVEQSGQISLAAGAHDIVVTFFEKTGGANLTVSWAGPGIAKQPLPGDKLTQPVKPESLSASHVRLVAFSEVNGNPWTSAAEVWLDNGAGTPLARTGWSATADIFEPTGSHGPGNAIDGDTGSIWHTEWTINTGDVNDPPHPHWLQLDLGGTQTLSALRYLPRSGGGNGTIAGYAIYTSNDGLNWGLPAAQGQFAPGGAEKSVALIVESEPLPNQAPTLVSPGPQSNTVGEAVSLALTASDPDGDTLTFSASGLPSGLSLNSATGLISGTPDTAQSVNVTVTVDDGTDSDSVQFNWDIAEVNLAPNVTQPAEQNNIVGDNVSLSISASDPNGDTLSYTATNLPAGLSIDTSSGVISGTAGAAGSHNTTVSVSDGQLSDSVSFAWDVMEQNFAPAIDPVADRTSNTNEAIAFALTASDPNGDALSFSASGLPAGVTVQAASGLISGTPTVAGVYAVTASVTDGALSDSTGFTWTVEEVLAPIAIAPVTSRPAQTDAIIDFTASATGGGTLEYAWSFGDGTPTNAFTTSPDASHTYTAPGRYLVTLTVRNAQEQASLIMTQAVHLPHTAGQPGQDSTIVLESSTGALRSWNVNPDNDTVSVIDVDTLSLVTEIPVGDQPMSLALVGNEIWVTNKRDATISRVSPTTLTAVGTIGVTRASAPHGIVANPLGGSAYVALESAQVVVELDTQGNVVQSIQTGADVRHISISADGTRLYASRFVTPQLPGEDTLAPSTLDNGIEQGGEIIVIDTGTGATLDTIELIHSNAGVSEHSGPGLPNYLRTLAVSPDGVNAYVPSKQDNILAGQNRNGFLLDHDHTVRAITSHVDLVTHAAELTKRIDVDNASIASAAAFGVYGSYVFVALEGNRMVAVVDAYRQEELFRFATGRAPEGLVMAPDGTTLLVHNFMERTVSAHDLTELIEQGVNNVTNVGTVSTVGSEALAADILLGKQHFYDALDPRLALEAYMSCASCHNEGGQDGRTWDFSQFGEGLRNTSILTGQGGVAEGPVHWTGNFDELQDFEAQIRSFAGGLGLMSDADFNSGTRAQPLGDPKAGLSADLDALAAYVNSLTAQPASPHRAADGSLTAAGEAGRQLFYTEGCNSCHTDAAFSDSASGARHNVGTINAASGQRLGGTLDGFDTPTLGGLWRSAPYLHNGSAATLTDAIVAHTTLGVAPADASQIAQFLLQVDDTQPNTPPVTATDPILETRVVSGVDSAGWTQVGLSAIYDDPAVACTIVNATNTVPQVTRVEVIDSTSFQVRLQNPSGAALSAETVHCMAAETGAWTLPDGTLLEVVKYANALVDENNAWSGEALPVTANFANPVVIGQVMSMNDARWSVFWSRGTSRSEPPSSAALFTGLSVAEDPDTSRVPETIAAFVFEAATGTDYDVRVGADTVLGWGDSATGYAYSFTQSLGENAVVIAAQTAEDGGNGGWAVMRGDPTSTTVNFSIDEDQMGDTERNHTTEQVAYLATAGERTYALTAWEPPVNPPGANLETITVTGVTDDTWRLVSLTQAHTDMVAVCNVVNTANTLPQVIRMREISDTQFEVRLQNPAGNNLAAAETVTCAVTSAGAWTLADGRKLEAQKYVASIVDENNSWVGTAQAYLHTYTNPVVLGQVMSYNDLDWSVFWSHGGSRTNPAGASLHTGYNVAEDLDTTRAPETVGYIVIEAGSGTSDGVAYESAVGADTIRGWSNSASGYTYNLSTSYSSPVAIATQAAMDGNNGGWSMVRNVSSNAIRLSIDEDQVNDTERSHTHEQVGYLVVEGNTVMPLQ